MNFPRPNKLIVIGLTVAFIFFITKGYLFGNSPPQSVELRFKTAVKVKWKKEGDKVIPLELILAGKTFPVAKEGGKYGIRMPLKQMAALVPEFKQQINLLVVDMSLKRVREIVGKDRALAQQVVDAIQAEAKRLRDGGIALDENYNQQNLSKAYNQMMNSQSFFYPQVSPGGWSGWELLEENKENTEEDEDMPETFLTWLAALLFAVVVLIMPIVGLMWLCATAITLATVTMAFLGTIGAIGVASIVGATIMGIDDLLHGKPLVQTW